jgi:membrane carboxypeptidase/penicillin-binding protein PbpC
MIPDENEQIILSASASNDIKEVEWFIDGKSIGTATVPSFRLEWQPTKGTHQITAQGKEVKKTISISIK